MSRAIRHCPTCSKRADPGVNWFPFCSERCRIQDLANWATGTYSIPVAVSEADEHLDPPRSEGEEDA